MSRNIRFTVLMSLMLLGFSSTAVSQFGDPVPRHPQEMDGLVNMINRSVYFSETDLAIPGRGLGINFTRYYNSDGYSRTIKGPAYIGYKWSHSYHWNFEAADYSTNNNYHSLAVITGTGSKQVFSVSPSHLSLRRSSSILAEALAGAFERGAKI